ncbi:interferon-induced helicase C domain-containing protein 1-like [Mercenaria mercenaria]|uniref:interferon-induced helicase C domain-containing protein 1-like n=1 Tax=Mercenaria mercenaria TaxID=6596 RepID=UPI00234EB46C|nr:interferon-induced helicase C domain-containing protein 1-like [Mercenaria mercenaria]
MATEENTYFLRSFLLLVEGGLYISRETLGRECQKAGGNLDALLKQCENKLKHEFHGKQYDKLFPQYGTTDINKWDLQLSVGVLINVFGRSLSLTEKQKLRALRDLRNEIYMHCASASLDQKKYEEVQEELEDIITTLAATFDKPVRDRCSAYITQFATGPLDGVKPSLATLNGFSQTCQKKLKVGLHTELVVGGPSDYWINLCEHTLDTILNNAESMASEGAGFEEIENNVKQMLDFLLANKNVVFKGSKKACIILMFECNSYDDALLFLQTLDSQEFRDHLSRISDALMRHYQFDATISISARVRTECLQSILIDILKMYRSEEIAHRQLEISSENETDDKGDHAKLMRGSEEEDSQKAESKQPLKLDLECTSKSGLLHFLNSFKKDDFSGHLKSVADALSKHFGKTITLKASLDIDDVMAAIEEAVSRDSTRCMTIQHGSEAIDLHEEELESDSFSDKITQRKKIGEREETTAKWVYDTSFDFAILTDKQDPTASVNYLSPNKPEECSVRGEFDMNLSFESLLKDAEGNSLDCELSGESSISSDTTGFCSTSHETAADCLHGMDQPQFEVFMDKSLAKRSESMAFKSKPCMLGDDQEALSDTAPNPSSTEKGYSYLRLRESSQSSEEMTKTDPGQYNITETANIKDDGVPIEDKDILLRNYQQELAAPALLGKNVIIVAPSGYDRTRVAMRIIQKHIRQKGRGIAKVVFLVNHSTIAHQEGMACRELLKQYTSKVITEESQRKSGYLKDYSDKGDILVVTAQSLLDALLRKEISDITIFSLIVFDECHHTCDNHTYNQIIRRYMDLKFYKPDAVLPQIVGLTVSVGVDQARNEERAVEHIKHLMANLDAHVICTVQKYIGELRQHVILPEEEIHKVQGRLNDVFQENIVKLMTTIEKRMTQSSLLMNETEVSSALKAPVDKGTFQYTRWVNNLCETVYLKLKSYEAVVFVNSCAKHLKLYNNALAIHYDARMKDAISYLDSKMNCSKENTEMNENDSILYGAFKKLRNARFCDSPNPRLDQLYQLITEAHERNFTNCRGIVFVKTNELSEAILSWMMETPRLMELNPIVFTGGLTLLSETLVNALQPFRTGSHKLIIATSAHEERLNIHECNFVIRYDLGTDEIVMVQSRGRGRATYTKYYEIAEQNADIAENKELNMIQQVMMRKAILQIQEYIQEYPDKFRQEIQNLQQETKLLMSLGFKYESFFRKHELRCIRCNHFICWSNDVKKFRGSYHAVIDERLSNRVIFDRSDSSRYKDIQIVGKLFCKRCGESLGVKCCHSLLDFSVLKISHFLIVDENGRQMTCKKWSSAPFQVAPLSSKDSKQW